jgi:hypothetical protein
MPTLESPTCLRAGRISTAEPAGRGEWRECFTRQYAVGTSSLHWDPNLEPDLAGDRPYRGAGSRF